MIEAIKSLDSAERVFARLNECAVEVVGQYLGNETPQTVAAILLLLPHAKAAEILANLPADARLHLLHRMARSTLPHPAAKSALVRVLERDFLTPALPIPPQRGDDVRKIIGLMASDLREGALAALDAPRDRAKPAPEYTGRAPMSRPAPATIPLRGERLPLLELVYDRLARRMSTSLRGLTGENVEVSLETSIATIGNANYLNTIPLPAMLCPFTVEDGGYGGLIAMDPHFIYSTTAAMLGFRCRLDQADHFRPDRWFTWIDRALVELIATSIIADLSAGFGEVVEVSFQLDGIETNPRSAGIAAPEESMLFGRLRIDMESGGGRMELLMPFSLFDPVLDVFSRRVLPPSRDPRPRLYPAHRS